MYFNLETCGPDRYEPYRYVLALVKIMFLMDVDIMCFNLALCGAPSANQQYHKSLASPFTIAVSVSFLLM